MKERQDQAVVVIHGIGEQKPMDTVRNFVDAVLPEPETSKKKYYSRPDDMSESFELRKLTQYDESLRTDFFEYYWAYKVQGTKFSHIIDWVRALLLRKPNNVPIHLKKLFQVSVCLVVLIIIGIIIALALGLLADLPSYVDAIPAYVSAILLFIFGALQNSIKDSLGDAARYLSPVPKNIALRHSIRSDGIKLLKEIHNRKKYERVIIVGHSLGSVIAYDIIKHLWYEYYRTYEKRVKHKQPAMKKIEEIGQTLSSKSKDPELKEFQDAQIELWKELRDLGNPWLITDFISLGCPLAHGFLLLAKDADEFEKRKKEREFPLCPPIADEKPINGNLEAGYSFIDKWIKKEGPLLKALHSAAPFACTRWTNFYFPAYGGLFGDLVGGPVRPWFGAGIRDIKVNWKGFWRFTMKTHSSYWKIHEDIQEDKQPLTLLKKYLDLNGKYTV